MDMLRRIIGAALIVIASVVAVHMIVEPLYHASSEASPHSPIWSIIDPFMALAVVLGTIFGYIRKRGVDREGGGAPGYPRVFGSQHAVLRFPVRWHPVLPELVQLPESGFYRNGDGYDLPGVGIHRRCAAAAFGSDGPVPAEGRQVSRLAGQRHLQRAILARLGRKK